MISKAAHVKSWLGEPTVFRRITLDEQRTAVNLLRIDDSPCHGATTLATAGLANLVRQLAAGRDPLIYGDVLGPAGPLVPGSSMAAIYVCEPTYYPAGFARFRSPGGCEIRIRWLVPISAGEALVKGDDGAEAFEGILVERDPDLLNLQRDPVVAAATGTAWRFGGDLP